MGQEKDREKAARERGEQERALEENGESWRSVGNRTWIAKVYVAPRPEEVPRAL